MTRLFDPTELLGQCPDDFAAPNASGREHHDLTMAGLFAGIGGLEIGWHEQGIRSELLCEWWAPAQAVLRDRFPDTPVVDDIRGLRGLPPVDVLTAGFPCTDLSLAGRSRGIGGPASGLVNEVFRLLEQRKVPWVVLENVRHMLVLQRGAAVRYLVDRFEDLGYHWAYRVVDSRFTGVPQRRQRVIFVASRVGDPREVLFAEEAGARPEDQYRDDAFGFYWTEGFRGLGWARDATPTLKGGSTIGIPSPPAIWNPTAPPGRRLVVPSITDAERLQGFPEHWTQAADAICRRKGTRWKLLGNAVTVGVSRWIAERLLHPRERIAEMRELLRAAPWPDAACGHRGRRWAAYLSHFPRHERYVHLSDLVDLASASPLSRRGAAGFRDRTRRGRIRFADGFLDDVDRHLMVTPGEVLPGGLMSTATATLFAAPSSTDPIHIT